MALNPAVPVNPGCIYLTDGERDPVMANLTRVIPGILNLTHGENTSTEVLSDGFTWSFVMLFENAAACDAYLPHTAHQDAVQKVVPRLARVIFCDHECEG